MKFLSAFLAAFIFISGASAQTPGAPLVIKDWCPWVVSLEFSPNGGELARFCLLYAVAMIDTTNYRRARTILTETEHTPQLQGFAYSPDGTMIATTMGNSSGARIWNAADPGKPIPDEESYSVVYKLYALDTPLRVLEVPEPCRGASNANVSWTGFSPDGKLLMTRYANHCLQFWNTSSWALKKELTDQELDVVLFSPDSKLVITVHENGHVKVWNTSSWTVEGELIVAGSPLTVAAFAPDSRTVMIGDKSGILHHWSLGTKTEIRTLRTFEDNGYRTLGDVAFSPGGEALVATSVLAAKPVIIWNTTDWIAQTETGYNSAAFSKDGKLLALGGCNHIKLIEPASQKEIRDIQLPEMTWDEVRRRNENEPEANEKMPCFVSANQKISCSVSALAFSPDGKMLAAGCRFPVGTVRLIKMIQ